MAYLPFKEKQIDFATRINTVLQNLLNQLVPSDLSVLSDAMVYSLLAEGKRIRPLLVYATGSLFGVSLDKLDAPAAAIESIHTYSLIHDDLPAMDNDELRRGKPTCHIKFGEAKAILAGDALQTLAFQLLSEAPGLSMDCKIALIKELALSSGANGMCAGQVFDLEAQHQDIDILQLKKIHHYKTGLLIRTAVRFGSLCAGEIALPYREILDEYAGAIGLAFQIQDDILNVTGDEEKMGKPSGSDMQLQKSTYPRLVGLTESRYITQTLYQQAKKALDKLPYTYNSENLSDLANFIIQRDN